MVALDLGTTPSLIVLGESDWFEWGLVLSEEDGVVYSSSVRELEPVRNAFSSSAARVFSCPRLILLVNVL